MYKETEKDMSETKNALIAMSGGVDSAVAAYIMKSRGWNCEGATMLLYRNADVGAERLGTCCSQKDIDDAALVADRLGIPYGVVDMNSDFKEKIIEKFIRTYEEGGTPNPCIDCNRYMKFERLMEYAEEKGFDCVVTGHYARIESKDGRLLLKKALDPSKDQSYVLYSLTQDQLSRVCFPIGELTKKRVREIASELGFVNAEKPDSQDICFVPDGDYAAFIERYTGKSYPEGDYLDTAGNVIGRHKGAIRYTIGQRKGLGYAAGHPVYVCSKCMENNTVTLGKEENLFSRELKASEVNWVSVPMPDGPIRCKAKTRYRQPEQPATAYPEGDGVRIVFDRPQRAITVGQSVVMYDGDLVLGGGVITGA